MRVEQVQEVVRLTVAQVNLAAHAREALAEGDRSFEAAARDMQAMADSGMSQRQIAAEVGCSRARVSYMAQALAALLTGVSSTWAEAMHDTRGKEPARQPTSVVAPKDVPRVWVREVADGFAALFPAGRLPFLEPEDLVAVKTIKLAAEQILEAYDESNR